MGDLTVQSYQAEDDVRAKLYALQTPEVTRSLDKMRKQYSEAPPIEEVRAMLGQALGDRSLTEELYRMRRCDE